jgi:NAD(P)-dependent dehydrogenase (short-subunit alcohol dehydrogenase family)
MSKMKRPERKIVLITGARSGIGRACADALAVQGHQVFGTSRTPPSETPGFTFLPMDVNDTDSVEAGVQSVLEETGRLDVVVNNAGFGYGGSVEDTSMAEAQALFETNVFGPKRVCQAVLPTMREQGSGLIVNVSSIGGLMGLPYQGLYSASKFAIEGLSEALRLEMKPFGVKVVMIEPGDFATGFTASRRRTLGCTADSPYAAACERSLVVMEHDETSSPPPDKVALAVERIINRPNPRLRYPVGPLPEIVAIYLKRIMPHRVFEWAIGKYYKVL